MYGMLKCERDRCKLNVIMYGLPESTSSDQHTKINDDKIIVRDVFSKLSADVHTEFKPLRLGKPTSTSSRPLKVIFGSYEAVSAVLSSYHLAKTQKLSLLPLTSLVRDRTILERQQLRTFHVELDRRVAAGEHNLTITFKNGSPCIISRSKTTSDSSNTPNHKQHQHPHRYQPQWILPELLRPSSPQTSSYNRGGGVLVAIRKDLASSPLFIPNISIDVYIPPSSPVEHYNTHLNTIDFIVQKYPNHSLILTGDYNLPFISWSNDTHGLCFLTQSISEYTSIPERLAIHGFYQHDYILNSHHSLLDLIFSNLSSLIVNHALDAAVPADPYHPPLSKIDSPKSLSRFVPGHREGWSEHIKGNFKDLVKLVSQFSPSLAVYIERLQIQGRNQISFISWQRQNQLISSVSKCINESIKKELGHTNFFCVSIDTTFNSSRREQLAFIVRYICTNEHSLVIREWLLGLRETSMTTDRQLFSVFQELFIENDMNWKLLLVGQSYDRSQQNALSLVIVQMSSCSANAVDTFGNLEQLYSLISTSKKRVAIYENMQKEKKS
ncbi:hypothetical protein AGLY_015086 [Aphis glycines]|uniref:Endonuclease/exonuclease/phosphatase domain-containing protein n=1 Tax=Aphis glycines TaxID=307491 RepID=A0A6G0T267_APHGL|nr:hypothetical protein AGLY_015086 [Aphis glycines]